jgi:N-acetylneuraminic acid mutarotase
MKKLPVLVLVLFAAALLTTGFYGKRAAAQWRTVAAQNEPEKRHENAFVRAGDYFYAFGGRKKRSVDRYDPKTNAWQPVAEAPLEMHHFQAVAFKGEIYVLGAFTGDFPHETPVPRVYIYNPQKDQWREGSEIPENRRRGAAGAVVHGNKIYLACGIIDGHYDGHVSWLDEFDPATGKWRTLPDAPRARDHVQVAVANNQLVVAGGRRSTHRIGHVLDLTVPEVDVYDLNAAHWKTLPADKNIPTQRAALRPLPGGTKYSSLAGRARRNWRTTKPSV